MKYTYLLVNLACLIPTLALSFHPRIAFYRQWRYLWQGLLAVAFFFLVWDAAFTYFRIWVFDPDQVTGIYILNLPLEEILFFICIPFACLFTFYCFEKFWPLKPEQKVRWQIFFIAGICLTIAGVIMHSRLYTSATFVLCGSAVAALSIFHSRLLLQTVKVFAFLVFPMLLSNGVLTGSFSNEPVVMYNDTENSGIRILRIPIEDFFYGYLFFVLNVWIYERLRAPDNVQSFPDQPDAGQEHETTAVKS